MGRTTVLGRTVMRVQVRPGRRADLPGIVGLYNHYVLNSPATFEITPVRAEERVGWLAEHSKGGPHRLLVAESGSGAVVGWATTSPFRPRAAYSTTVESSVYCRPDAVGKGVGTRLYDRLFREIEREDVERIVAGIALPNPASVALHRGFGFRHVGTFTHVGRKFGRYWDVAWFERPRRLPGVGGSRPLRGRGRGRSSGTDLVARARPKGDR